MPEKARCRAFALGLQGKKWEAGFAKLDDPAAYQEVKTGTVLVLDYPEENLKHVEQLFGVFAQQQEAALGGKWRILLLSRRQEDFWRPILDRTGVTRFVAPPMLLEPPRDDSFAIFDAAHRIANKVLQGGAAQISETRFHEWQSAAPENLLPLFVVAAAVHDVLRFRGEFDDGEVAETRPLGFRGREGNDRDEKPCEWSAFPNPSVRTRCRFS